MKFKNIFENDEFDRRLLNVEIKIASYLKEKNFDLGENSVSDLISHNDFSGATMIYASEQCPEEIKNIVANYIKEEFPLNSDR